MKKLLAILLLLTGGCTGIPENIQPVTDFKLNNYLGQWYEIARLEHSFERDLTQVTANYSVREDGSVKVINRGYLSNRNGKRRKVRRILCSSPMWVI